MYVFIYIVRMSLTSYVSFWGVAGWDFTGLMQCVKTLKEVMFLLTETNNNLDNILVIMS